MMNKKRIVIAAVFLLAALVFSAGKPLSTCAASSAKLKKQVKKIVDLKTKKSDSKKVKLKKLAKFVESGKFGYKRTIGFKNKKGWDKKFASDFLKQKKGSCYGYAAGFAYLAKYAVGAPVRIGIGKANGFSGKMQIHAWTEVKIGKSWYICDVNMDKYAAKGSGKYFLKKRNALKKTYNKYKKTVYVKVAF